MLAYGDAEFASFDSIHPKMFVQINSNL